jgi:hypothetical protein
LPAGGLKQSALFGSFNRDALGLMALAGAIPVADEERRRI